MAYGTEINNSNIVENWLFQLGFGNGDSDGSGEGGFDQVLQSDGTSNLVDDSGGFTDSSETFTVDDGSVFVVGDYIKIDNEVILITGKSGDLLEISRGQHGTSSASHNDNALIFWYNFLPLSFTDVNDLDFFYHGVVLNRPSLRESIDLEQSTAKTSNISISIPDFQYKGNPISELLIFGTKKFINRQVNVFSKINNQTKVKIGEFRLTNIQQDDSKLELSLNAHRPFKDITYPQDKTSLTNQYVPYIVGDYTANDSFFDTPAFCDTRLYPVPVLNVDEDRIRTIMPRQFLSSSSSQINIHQGGDVFLPLMSSTGAKNNTTKLIEEVNCLETKTARLAVGRVFATEARNIINDSHTEFSNTHLAFDKDTSTSATVGIVGADSHAIAFSTVSRMFTSHSIKSVRLRHKYQGTASINVFIFAGDTQAGSASVSFSPNTFTVTTIDVSSVSPNVSKQFTIIYIKTSGSNGTLSLGSVKVDISTAFDATDRDELKTLSEIKHFYSGAGALKETYSGSSNFITKIHEAHRDLLIRYTGLSTSVPDGWNDVDTDKDWKLRYWQLEPISLEEGLEKMQKEGGFIYSPNRGYIHIKTSESSDVTLTKKDLSNISISHTPLSELKSFMVINYDKHPAEDRYQLSIESSNTTTRKEYNIKEKENKSQVDLDMYVSPTIPASPNSNPNNDYYSYYDNIFGSVKAIISANLVNPKFFNHSDGNKILGIGSKISFTDMFPENIFGKSFSNLIFIITNFNRSQGRVSFTAREIA